MPDSATGLGPGSAVPWNPPAALPDAAPWESVLRLPGRIVSLPLSGLGYLARRQLLRSEEASHVPRMQFFLVTTARFGISVAPAGLGDGSGFGGAVRYTPAIPGRPFEAALEGSTRGYNRTKLAARAGPLDVEYAYEWRPRERFYGPGPDSDHDDVSTYASQREAVRLAAGWPWRRTPGSGPRVRAAAWIGPRRIVVREGRESPSFDRGFPALASAQLDAPLEHLVHGARLVADLRSGRPHWGHGARFAVEAERFGRPLRALALHGARSPAASWTRVTLECEAGVSFMRDPRTLRVALRAVDNRTGDGVAVPLPDLATLGGSAGLSGFEHRRFHDRGSVLGRLSYIFPLAEHFEFDVHAEAGGVCRDVWRDARVAGLENSYGVALRPRTMAATLGVLGVDWSDEAVRIHFSIGGVE